MKNNILRFLLISVCFISIPAFCKEKDTSSVTVPVILDHNRMLVDGEIQKTDGTWHKVRFWIDTGNPDFFMSKDLALDLGIDLSAIMDQNGIIKNASAMDINPPAGIRIGGMPLNFNGVKAKVIVKPEWLFNTMHNDANLPSTVLKQYHVIFDYPCLSLTLAGPGSIKPRGMRVSARINSKTGIVQIDGIINEEKISMAIDNGASYSFISLDKYKLLSQKFPDVPHILGAIGCANIWGWWPEEENWETMRLPDFNFEGVHFTNIGITGLPDFFPAGMNLGKWYSQKTARPVDGFLGPNALKPFRVEIDYLNSAVYFEKTPKKSQGTTTEDIHDMDIIGITLRPEAMGGYKIIGIAEKDSQKVVTGIEPGDLLISIDGIKTNGKTMGTVFDALRGKPGDTHTLEIERKGSRIKVDAKVLRLL